MPIDIDNASLYKIGTGWVFDVGTNKGYRVERISGGRKGKVKTFVPVFEVVKKDGSPDIIYSDEVPMGVIRKAIQLSESYLHGELGEKDGRARQNTRSSSTERGIRK